MVFMEAPFGGGRVECMVNLVPHIVLLKPAKRGDLPAHMEVVN